MENQWTRKDRNYLSNWNRYQWRLIKRLVNWRNRTKFLILSHNKAKDSLMAHIWLAPGREHHNHLISQEEKDQNNLKIPKLIQQSIHQHPLLMDKAHDRGYYLRVIIMLATLTIHTQNPIMAHSMQNAYFLKTLHLSWRK